MKPLNRQTDLIHFRKQKRGDIVGVILNIPWRNNFSDFYCHGIFIDRYGEIGECDHLNYRPWDIENRLLPCTPAQYQYASKYLRDTGERFKIIKTLPDLRGILKFMRENQRYGGYSKLLSRSGLIAD